ncbi:TPA: transcriptional regulator [Bacillus cereus]
MENLYIITYTHVMSDGTSKEKKSHYFDETQKAQFLSKYASLKNAWFCFNLEAYKAEKVAKLDVDSLLNF